MHQKIAGDYSLRVNARKLVFFIFIFLAGCVGTKAGAFRIFQEDLNRIIGKNLEDSYIYYVGKLSETKPVSVSIMNGGNESRHYEFTQNRLSPS